MHKVTTCGVIFIWYECTHRIIITDTNFHVNFGFAHFHIAVINCRHLCFFSVGISVEHTFFFKHWNQRIVARTHKLIPSYILSKFNNFFYWMSIKFVNSTFAVNIRVVSFQMFESKQNTVTPKHNHTIQFFIFSKSFYIIFRIELERRCFETHYLAFGVVAIKEAVGWQIWKKAKVEVLVRAVTFGGEFFCHTAIDNVQVVKSTRQGRVRRHRVFPQAFRP